MQRLNLPCCDAYVLLYHHLPRPPRPFHLVKMHPSESHTSARVRIGAWCYVALSISTAADATSDSGETAALLSLYNATSGAAWSCGGTLPLDDRCNITANIATSREEAQESMCDGDCKANPYAGILPGTFFVFSLCFTQQLPRSLIQYRYIIVGDLWY